MPYYPESVLSERHVFTILMCALERGSIRSSDVHEYIKNWGTISERLDFMVKTGLLKEQVIREGRVSVNYVLTPAGEFVAKMMKVCDRAVNGEFDVENGSVDAAIRKQRSSGRLARPINIFLVSKNW
jgi:DNA-binding HxlR family transcriptional regulator